MSDELYRLADDRRPLDAPVLVLAPDGWIDAGLGGMECELQIKGLTRKKMIEFLAEGK